MSAKKLIRQLEIARALESDGEPALWAWYCSTHLCAGRASTKEQIEWLADSHQISMAKKANKDLLNDVDDLGVPKLTVEELSECRIDFVRQGVPHSAKAFAHS